MTLYGALLALHLGAAFLWLGHMFFWSVFVGPVMKRFEPRPAAERLRAVGLRLGGLGWPALAVLAATGVWMLAARGTGPGDVFSADLLASPAGRALAGKLALVAAMVGYQAVFGHRPAPRAIWLNMTAALLVLAASVWVARG